MRRGFLAILLAFCVIQITHAGSVDIDALQPDFDRIAAGYPGRVGACVIQNAASACVNGDKPFALQSVMKLLVALAVMDAVDHKGWRLDESVTLHKDDLSLFVQPIAKLLQENGAYTTTIADLVRRAIVDSDSAATDYLIAKLGGPKAVQSFLNRKQIRGVRFDRDEKHLQTEIVGLTWTPAFLDPAVLDETIKRVPKKTRDSAAQQYRSDPRDTATPMGMAVLLQRLSEGKLLPANSTSFIIDTMGQTVTYPNRLKAGVTGDWRLAHKTGTSGTWNEVTAVINDVGLLKAPDGTTIPIAVLLGDSKASEEQAGNLMSRIAAATIARYR